MTAKVHPPPGATAVVDVGGTHSKLLLFDGDGRVLTEEARISEHRDGPPYLWLDPEPLLAFLATRLPALDRRWPIDTVVVSAHGSGLALLDDAGALVLPVMDYQAEPPAALAEEYRQQAPPFAEVFAPTNPMALTLGLQLHWQERAFPESFGRVARILPWGQYLAWRLGGAATSEVTALGAQTHLWDPRRARPSSLAEARGWSRLLAPLRPAWARIGRLAPAFCGGAFRGAGQVLTGIHDSNANYLRYLAAGWRDFTLLSTGTWIIGFDDRARLETLDPRHDTCANVDVFGRPVASCRFMGGRELALLLGDTPAEAADLESLRRVVDRGVCALPAFTDSGGPVPACGGRGRLVGPPPESPAERAALATLYVALMTDRSLAALGTENRLLVDGPFALNPLFLGLLAALRPGQAVAASRQRDGTAAGAALLARIGADGALPRVDVDLQSIAPLPLPELADYAQRWQAAL